MNHSLALEPATALSPGRRPEARQPSPLPTDRRPAQPVARPAPSAVFVERRAQALADRPAAIRSPIVLGFAGMVGGMLLSAALIVAIALVLAWIEVRWANAISYSLATVVVVFGSAAAALYWDIGQAATRLLARIEPVVERRAYYFHLSALNAFDNLRTLETARRPVTCPVPAATPSAVPAPSPAGAMPPAALLRPAPTARRIPTPQRFYSQHEATARAPMNNWAWDRTEVA